MNSGCMHIFYLRYCETLVISLNEWKDLGTPYKEKLNEIVLRKMIWQTQLQWLSCTHPIFMEGLFALNLQSHHIDTYLFLTSKP